MGSERFILIPGRSTEQGTSVGDKASAQYREVTRTLRMNPDDMKRLGLADIDLTVTGGRITKAKNACVLGKAWFLDHQPDESRPEALIGGLPATTGEAVDEAARLLRTARYPVVYGLSDTTAEAQRVAV